METNSSPKELFYVGLRDPSEVRKNILESSRDIVIFLKTYENFKRIRLRKIEEINKLKLKIQEIVRLVNKLSRELPKTRLRAKPEEALRKGGARRSAGLPKRTGPEKAVNVLESQLGEIEQKLKTI